MFVRHSLRNSVANQTHRTQYILPITKMTNKSVERPNNHMKKHDEFTSTTHQMFSQLCKQTTRIVCRLPFVVCVTATHTHSENTNNHIRIDSIKFDCKNWRAFAYKLRTNTTKKNACRQQQIQWRKNAVVVLFILTKPKRRIDKTVTVRMATIAYSSLSFIECRVADKSHQQFVRYARETQEEEEEERMNRATTTDRNVGSTNVRVDGFSLRRQRRR